MPNHTQKDLSTFETTHKSKNRNNNNKLILSPAKALTAGTQMWLITDSHHSSWTHLIDWYLNFQITKNRQQEISQQSSPLLIASPSLLACQQVLELPYTKNWLTQSFDIWHSLNCPSLRVFLPKLVDISKAQECWLEFPVQFVPEPHIKY